MEKISYGLCTCIKYQSRTVMMLSLNFVKCHRISVLAKYRSFNIDYRNIGEFPYRCTTIIKVATHHGNPFYQNAHRAFISLTADRMGGD